VPDRGDEIVLAHHPLSVLNEIYQQIEDLRLEGNQLAGALELAAIRVEGVTAAKDEQVLPPGVSEETPTRPLRG
jgi:hypothetical protein